MDGFVRNGHMAFAPFDYKAHCKFRNKMHPLNVSNTLFTDQMTCFNIVNEISWDISAFQNIEADTKWRTFKDDIFIAISNISISVAKR